MKYTQNPHDWADITKEWLGPRLDQLRVLANNGKPPKVLEKEIIGQDLIKAIKELGEKPVCGIGRIKK